MNKRYLIGIIIFLVMVGIVFIISKSTSDKFENSEKNEIQNAQAQGEAGAVMDYKNSTYIVDGKSIALIDGFSEIEAAPGSASKIQTRYFGNEIKHDLNNDGREDIVFLLTQERGGSGMFYYVVAALDNLNGYKGSEAYFLGDRIAPQSINIDEGQTTNGTKRDNVIVVNFATRKADEPFSMTPTVGKSIWIKLDPATMQFGEVVQDFEGERR